MLDRGWPGVVIAASGNGGHLLARLDLPNDDETHELLETCLNSPGPPPDDQLVEVDPATFNATQMWKVYDTKSYKGHDLPERPAAAQLVGKIVRTGGVVTVQIRPSTAGYTSELRLYSSASDSDGQFIGTNHDD